MFWTDLKLPHQEADEGSVDAALHDQDGVGDFGVLGDPHVIPCRESEGLVKQTDQLIQSHQGAEGNILFAFRVRKREMLQFTSSDGCLIITNWKN